jgi:hypothetical protein
MRAPLGALVIAGALMSRAAPVHADSEIVVAIRYLQAQGASHSHLYLYRQDGKLLRQLTKDNSGQDIDPIFASSGEKIVFTRERTKAVREFWSVDPLGTGLKKLDAAPEWYKATKSSPYFTNREEEQPEQPASSTPEASSAQGPALPNAMGKQGEATPHYQAPDGSVEIILQTSESEEDDQYDGPGHGKHFLLHDLKSGREVELGKVPGFLGLFELLHGSDNKDRQFLFDGPLRLAFFDLHLDSTAGDTDFALDLNGPRLVQLSPNWAAPIPLPGEPAFLTVTENRYVKISGGSKTANCSYIERRDAKLNKVRYAREGSAAICYGASMYRPAHTPATITIRTDAK